MEASQARLTFSPGQLENYRASRLSSHFKYARHSPFWADRFLQYSVNPNASDPFAELAKLPILTKSEVRIHAKQIQNPLFEGSKLLRLHTSGTTGSGLVFKETLDSESERWSVWWRYRQKLGLDPDNLCALFGGRCLIPVSQKDPPFWRHSPYTRQIFFSSQHLSQETFRFYLAEIERANAPWIHGYPSSLALLATWMTDAGISPPQCLRFVTTGAENLPQGTKRRIEKAFGLPVYQHYGLAESTANFSQEPDGRIYVDEDFSCVEFPASDHGASRRVIGTNWHNPAFPLFRYDSSDLCEVAMTVVNGPRSREILSIDGRQEDAIILKNGVYILCLNQVFADLTNVQEAQVRQTAIGKAEFMIVKGRDYGAVDEAALAFEIKKRFGELCDVRIAYVDALPRTASGKLRLVVSEIPPR
jgi:phenylacetate-CoA ligase